MAMQTTVLNQMRVQVFQVEVYDIQTDMKRLSRRMATEVGAARMGGAIIPDTAVLINADQLESGEQWTPIDFIPE